MIYKVSAVKTRNPPSDPPSDFCLPFLLKRPFLFLCTITPACAFDDGVHDGVKSLLMYVVPKVVRPRNNKHRSNASKPKRSLCLGSNIVCFDLMHTEGR